MHRKFCFLPISRTNTESGLQTRVALEQATAAKAYLGGPATYLGGAYLRGADLGAGLTCAGLTCAGLTWAGLTCAGLTWAGLTWAGLTWAGLTWAGLTWATAQPQFQKQQQHRPSLIWIRCAN